MRWNEKLQAFHDAAARLSMAAEIEPEDAKAESGVNGSLSFFLINTQEGESGLATLEQAASVDGTEGALKVHTGAKIGDGVLGKVSGEHYFESTGVAKTMPAPGTRSAPVTHAANLESGGLVLAEALDKQFENVVLDLSVKHTPNDVALG